MHDNLDVEFTIAQKSVCMWKYTPALQNGFYYYAEYAPKLDSVLKYSCCNVLSNILSDCIVIWNPGIYFMYMHCSILKFLKCVVCVGIGFLGQVTDQHVILCMHMHDMH